MGDDDAAPEPAPEPTAAAQDPRAADDATGPAADELSLPSPLPRLGAGTNRLGWKAWER